MRKKRVLLKAEPQLCIFESTSSNRKSPADSAKKDTTRQSSPQSKRNRAFVYEAKIIEVNDLVVMSTPEKIRPW